MRRHHGETVQPPPPPRLPPPLTLVSAFRLNFFSLYVTFFHLITPLPPTSCFPSVVIRYSTLSPHLLSLFALFVHLNLFPPPQRTNGALSQSCFIVSTLPIPPSSLSLSLCLCFTSNSTPPESIAGLIAEVTVPEVPHRDMTILFYLS